MSSITGKNVYIKPPSSVAPLSPVSLQNLTASDKLNIDFGLYEEKLWIWIGEQEEKEKKDTEEFLKLAGTWEDERSAEEIIKDIYDSRRSSQREDYGL